jgi:DNA-binding transcriptional LysR family regulator
LRSWQFKIDGRAHHVTPEAGLTFNDPELVLKAAIDGEGLAQLPAFEACDALRAGSLVTCLEEFAPDDGGHYLCYLSRKQLPKRIRAFVDFMTTSVRALDLDPSTIARRDAPPVAAIAGMGG